MSEKNTLKSHLHNNLKMKKSRLFWVRFILALLLAISAFWVTYRRQENPQSLYTAAVTDAIIADVDEIEPLIELTWNSPMTTWDNRGRVLLLSWHHHPDRYTAREEITLTNGPVWTFTDQEIVAWYDENKSGVTNWNLRLEQLIGLPPDAGYTHVSGFLVKPADVLRPAYVTDTTKQMQNVFPNDINDDFMKWFEENSTYSYVESAYPWTRLGYTYDWANNGTEYGLTEFLIEENASVEIVFTKTTAEFISWLDQGASLDVIVSKDEK